MRFQGKVAIVTGGSRGMGWAIAHALAMEGATVALIARNTETGNEAAAQIEADGGKAFFLQADVSKRDQVLRAVSETIRRLGRVDILVNNAGIHKRAPFDQETRSDWLLLFEVNVLGTVFPSQAVVPHMVEQGRRTYRAHLIQGGCGRGARSRCLQRIQGSGALHDSGYGGGLGYS